MSAPPYMKLFWGDYHKATRHLTRDQHGAYFLLIGEAWRLGGSLPDDDRVLAAWALCTPQEWADMKPIITAFFTLRRGKWVHDRVREELAHYENVSRKRKSAGKRGGSASVGKQEENPEAIASQKTTKPEPEPEPEKEDNSSFLPPPDGDDEGDKPVRGKVAKRKPETSIPAGYPDEKAITDAQARIRAEGVNLDANVQAERFRNHAAQNDRRARDWAAAWRNWIVGAIEKAPKQASPTLFGASAAMPAQTFRGPPALRQSVVAAVDESFAVKFIDPATWRPEDRTLVAANGFAVKQIERTLRDWLVSSKVRVEVAQPEGAAA